MAFRPRLRERRERGIPLRAVVPNAITALALCSGLSGVRFAIGGEWERAVGMIVLAGVLDGLDGRVARMLRGESRFGAELDSLADAISFGVSPALVLYLWSLQYAPRLGWISALMLAVFCALRLARFNAQIDADEQPRKAAGYFTGVPAPAGAGTGDAAVDRVAVDRAAGASVLLAGRAMGRGRRDADGVERPDLQLEIVPAAPHDPVRGDRGGGRAWRVAGGVPVADADRSERRVSRGDPVFDRRLCADQAARWRCSVAGSASASWAGIDPPIPGTTRRLIDIRRSTRANRSGWKSPASICPLASRAMCRHCGAIDAHITMPANAIAPAKTIIETIAIMFASLTRTHLVTGALTNKLSTGSVTLWKKRLF